MMMERLFQLMKEKNASDMFFAVNSPVHIKINGNLIPINQNKLEPENIRVLLAEIPNPEQMEELERENELNMGISVPNLGRFRLSAFRQRGSISAVFRFVPATIPPLSELGLPPVLSELIMEKRGLMLIVGALRSFVVLPFNIPSESMQPRLLIGDYLLVAKWPYGYSRYSLPFSLPLIPGRILPGTPERGDVVVFKAPPSQRQDYIKRVIGLPGDII